MDYITEKEIDRIAGETGRQLAGEKRVELILAPEQGNEYWEGGINGYFLRIKRGEKVSVPESIARLIAESQQVSILAERRVAEYKRGSGKKLSV